MSSLISEVVPGTGRDEVPGTGRDRTRWDGTGRDGTDSTEPVSEERVVSPGLSHRPRARLCVPDDQHAQQRSPGERDREDRPDADLRLDDLEAVDPHDEEKEDHPFDQGEAEEQSGLLLQVFGRHSPDSCIDGGIVRVTHAPTVARYP